MNSGKCYKLVIERKSEFTGMALKTNVLINGSIKRTLSNGTSFEIELPRNFTSLKLSNKVALGKEICKELVVDPVNNSEVKVHFYYKMNWIAMIPPLMYMMPTSTIITEIKYTP